MRWLLITLAVFAAANIVTHYWPLIPNVWIWIGAFSLGSVLDALVKK